jgi:hypothetical protein
MSSMNLIVSQPTKGGTHWKMKNADGTNGGNTIALQNRKLQMSEPNDLLDGFAFMHKAKSRAVEFLSLFGVLSTVFVESKFMTTRERARQLLQQIVDEHMNVYWLKDNWIVIDGREDDWPDHLKPKKKRVRIRKKPSKWKDVSKP